MRYILILLLGAILGGGLVFYFLVGAPRAKMTGTPIKPPEAGGDAPGTLLVTFDEKFFDTLLGTIFKDLNAPSFRVSATEPTTEGSVTFRPAVFQEGCTNAVVIAPEGSNVKTGVHFTGGKIVAPLAFSGSYNILGNCTQFKGWAQGSIQLFFDQSKQTVYGQINVEGVNLEGVPAILSGPITLFVQNAINERVNPLEVLRGQQLALNVPVQASNGTLKAQVKDVHSEVKDGSLVMHITYDFSGAKEQR